MDFLYIIDNILTDKECERYIRMFNNPKNVETNIGRYNAV